MLELLGRVLHLCPSHPMFPENPSWTLGNVLLLKQAVMLLFIPSYWKHLKLVALGLHHDVTLSVSEKTPSSGMSYWLQMVVCCSVALRNPRSLGGGLKEIVRRTSIRILNTETSSSASPALREARVKHYRYLESSVLSSTASNPAYSFGSCWDWSSFTVICLGFEF